MIHRYSREELLIGPEGLEKLRRARVAVFGVGGVGGYVVEALARSGIGALDLFDGDRVSLTNINRQIIALESTVGKLKVEVARDRVLDIDPQCRVEARPLFFTPENAHEVDFSQYDYVADAIDTVSSKIELIRLCREAGVPVISSMGAGNKLDPTAFRVADVENQRVSPGPGDAPGVEAPGHHGSEGGVFHRGIPAPGRRRPGGHQRHRRTSHARKHGLCSQCGGTDPGGRNRQGLVGSGTSVTIRKKGYKYGTNRIAGDL